MNYKLKIHYLIKNFLLRINSIGLLPNFIKKLSLIISEVSNNYSFDRSLNGENNLVKILKKKKMNLKVIFDVGANNGYWSKYFNNYFSNCSFYLFEITPSKLRILNKIRNKNFKILNFGLGKKNKIDFFYEYPSLDGENSLYNTRPDVKSKKTKTKFQKGDFFCKKNKIDKIDFLKIDVEGMELEVLIGFKKMIQKKKIQLVQFEYTVANSISRYLLSDLYNFFRENDYVVGKLTSNGIIFLNKFNLDMNNFKFGPNFVACPRKNLNLIKKITFF